MIDTVFTGPLDDPPFVTPTSKRDLPKQMTKNVVRVVVAGALATGALFSAMPSPAAGSGDLAEWSRDATEAEMDSAAVDDTASNDLLQNWEKYRQDLAANGGGLGTELSRFWTDLVQAIDHPPVPTVVPDAAGPSLLLSWDQDIHHLEIEIFEDHYEWFYRDRSNGRFAGESVDRSKAVDRAGNYLGLFQGA